MWVYIRVIVTNNEMVRFWIYFDGKADKIC